MQFLNAFSKNIRLTSHITIRARLHEHFFFDKGQFCHGTYSKVFASTHSNEKC